MKGVLVTCNEKEKMCVKEACNVLNEVRNFSLNENNQPLIIYEECIRVVPRHMHLCR